MTEAFAMLIEYGNTTVKPDWELNEEAPAGYSRIYDIISGDLAMHHRAKCVLYSVSVPNYFKLLDLFWYIGISTSIVIGLIYYLFGK